MTLLAAFTRQEFLPFLAQKISALGLTHVPKEQVFVAPRQDCTIGVSYQLSYYQPDAINIAVRCAVSLHEVQRRLIEVGYYQFRGKPTLTWTLGRNIGHIAGNCYAVWPLSHTFRKDQCDDLAEEIAFETAANGLPYLEKYASQEAVFEIALQRGPCIFDFATVEHRSLVAVILAKTLNSGSLIDDIIESTLEYYRDDRFYLDRFQNLSQGLLKS